MQPRCPLGHPCLRCCLRPSCPSSPYVCPSPSCPCQPAHLQCPTMPWESILALLCPCPLPPWALSILTRVSQLYESIIHRASAQLRVLREYLEEQAHGGHYARLKEWVRLGQYDRIGCGMLGEVVTGLMGVGEGEGRVRFGAGEVRGVEDWVEGMFRAIEELYKGKCQGRSYFGGTGTQGIKSNSIDKNNSNKSKHKHSSSYLTPKKQKPSSQLFIQHIQMTKSQVLARPQSASLSTKLAATTATSFNPMPKNTIINSPIFAQLNPQLLKQPCYPKTINSKIVSTASTLNHLLGVKVKEYKLVFRASENNYEIGQFYDKMAKMYHNRKAVTTVLLLRTQHQKVIGGCTALRWQYHAHNPKTSNKSESDSDHDSEPCPKYRQDLRGSSFLFSVDLAEKYPLLSPQHAIYCGRGCIGFGKRDLRIRNRSHQHTGSSLAFPGSYNNGKYLPGRKSSWVLAGGHGSGGFRVPEWELFEVVFSGGKGGRV